VPVLKKSRWLLLKREENREFSAKVHNDGGRPYFFGK
jgi:hypothetical protein